MKAYHVGIPGVALLLISLAAISGDLLAQAQIESAPPVTAGDEQWDTHFGDSLTTGVTAIIFRGEDLLIGGGFFGGSGAADQSISIARWNGSAFTTLVMVSGSASDTRVYALAVSGNDLYAAGAFTKVGTVNAKNIARWDGSTWSALGNGTNREIHTVAIDGSNITVGGTFFAAGTVAANKIARWNGSLWQTMAGGMDDEVDALAVLNGTLYAAGDFTSAGTTVNHIAQWNGTSWAPLGSGLQVNGAVNALLAVDGMLYVAGQFTTAGGITVNNIARWDGSAWQALGSGTNGIVRALAASNGHLYAGGSFTTAGGVTVNRIAMWDGAKWSAMGSGVNNDVRALAARGDELYVGGGFTSAGGKPTKSFARWSAGASSSVDMRATTSPPSLMAASNPASGMIQIRLTIPTESHARLMLIDMLGKCVATLIDEHVIRGERVVHIDTDTFAPGLYFCRLEAGSSVATARIQILH